MNHSAAGDSETTVMMRLDSETTVMIKTEMKLPQDYRTINNWDV